LKRLFAHRLAPPLVLVVATLVWGISFVVTRQAVQGISPLVFVGVRFGIAAIVVALTTRPRLWRLTRLEARAGAIIACAMFGGYGMQAVGLHLGIGSGRAAFITALYVPIVPLLQLVLLRRRPSLPIWIGLGFACAGLMLMAGPLGQAGSGVAQGTLLLGAFALACEILLIGFYAARVDPRRLAVVECSALSALCFAVTALSGQAWPAPAPGWIVAAIALGAGSAALQIAVNWAQRAVPPSRATLIYTLEPVWASGFGMLAGERMGMEAVAGAALILASLVISGREKTAASPSTHQARVAP